jgi:hypothetical protein
MITLQFEDHTNAFRTSDGSGNSNAHLYITSYSGDRVLGKITLSIFDSEKNLSDGRFWNFTPDQFSRYVEYDIKSQFSHLYPDSQACIKLQLLIEWLAEQAEWWNIRCHYNEKLMIWECRIYGDDVTLTLLGLQL